MHNNIMAAGSRDRPPMLATGRYAQWRSRFLRYIDTRPNGDALRKCILTGPYIPTMVTTPAVPATEDSPEIPAKTSVETVLNMTPENKAHYESEKEAIHLILTGIGDEIYSTVDACQTAQEMWEAIESFWKKTVNVYEQRSEDKDMQKEFGSSIAKYFKKTLQNPTNKHLRTSSNQETRMWILIQDTRMTIDLDSLGNQRACKMLLGLGKLNAESQKASGIQYHKEKMLMCKQAEKDVQLQAEQSDWLADPRRGN
ncbi:hypothetical protein Tco_0091864 [Tanacetum coccineum]